MSTPTVAERRCAADTRDALLRAARRHFSVHGYAGATLRGIAAEAQVSAALLVKYFGSKEGLLAAASDIEAETAALLDAPNATLGRHLVATLLDLHDRAEADPLVRVVLTGPRPGGERIVEELDRRLIKRLADRLDGPDARLRAEMVCAQLIGLGAVRLLLSSPATVAEPPAALVDRLGPILQAWIDPPAVR
ncbi:TetR family transcriptional regulator [Pseudonocardia sulfidoxydans NBRC 16205]|uniref:TetR family transcriptional regulator n=1 Tax=Pseudonocardia sulfidoxydans NBRC 16205 TaxID=1223511 RepID=A0A511DD38_9PSEU|nr:TetR/AcrR family transcriptional regulator [Pseudonocardia sulfidoxydans]GEL22467.1 TetR family transcriptional regulator [Pseudonocardia sulfidoxydans NBRC 16205]